MHYLKASDRLCTFKKLLSLNAKKFLKRLKSLTSSTWILLFLPVSTLGRITFLFFWWKLPLSGGGPLCSSSFLLHFSTPWFIMAFITMWIPKGRNQIMMIRSRKLEFFWESWAQMITGCKQIKGWIIVKMTKSVVKTSMFWVLEAKWESLKSTVPQYRPPPTPWNRKTMVKLTTVRLNPFRLTFRTWLANSCMDSFWVMKEAFDFSKMTSLQKRENVFWILGS